MKSMTVAGIVRDNVEQARFLKVWFLGPSIEGGQQYRFAATAFTEDRNLLLARYFA